MGTTTQHCSEQPASDKSTIHLPAGEASSILYRKEQIASPLLQGNTLMFTRSIQDNQGKTLPLLSSLLHILPSVGPMDLMPRKGRSEGDASTKMIASSCCINNTKPLKEKNLFTYVSSNFRKEINQRTSDKVGNETPDEQTTTSTITITPKNLNNITVLHIYSRISQATNCQVKTSYKRQVG